MNPSNQWQIVKLLNGEYLTVWKVVRRRNGILEVGFFKFTEPKYYGRIGPLLANELICSRLAQVVGLPAATTRLEAIHGKTGVLSLVKQRKKVKTWNETRHKQSGAHKLFLRPERLYKTFVFDVWVCNIDRSGKNIIVYPEGNKYDFYLIDHELALLGAVRYEGRRWDSTYWDDVVRYTDGYEPALLSYGRDYTRLVPFVTEIHRIHPVTIRRIINSVPSRFISADDKILVQKLLLRRRRRLSRILSLCSKRLSSKP